MEAVADPSTEESKGPPGSHETLSKTRRLTEMAVLLSLFLVSLLLVLGVSGSILPESEIS